MMVAMAVFVLWNTRSNIKYDFWHLPKLLFITFNEWFIPSGGSETLHATMFLFMKSSTNIEKAFAALKCCCFHQQSSTLKGFFDVAVGIHGHFGPSCSFGNFRYIYQPFNSAKLPPIRLHALTKSNKVHEFSLLVSEARFLALCFPLFPIGVLPFLLGYPRPKWFISSVIGSSCVTVSVLCFEFFQSLVILFPHLTSLIPYKAWFWRWNGRGWEVKDTRKKVRKAKE